MIEKLIYFFVGVNAQFYDCSEKNTRVLNLMCREFKSRHTADNIQSQLVVAKDLFLLKDEQLLAIAIDSAANITKAADDLIKLLNDKSLKLMLGEEIDLDETVDEILDPLDDSDETSGTLQEIAIRISCVVHKLQLAVNKFMWKDETVSKIINKAVKVSAKLRTPIVRLQMEVEGVNNGIMNQVTRWNSTYLMLKRLVELKDFCIKFQGQKGFEELQLAQESWNQFTQLLQVLECVAVLTTLLQAENLNVPDFIYHWFSMKMKLESLSDSSYALKLVQCIKEREKVIFQNKIVLAGWYLDKNLNVLMSPEQISMAKSVVRMVAAKRESLSPQANFSNEEQMETDHESDSSAEESFDKFLKLKGKEAAATDCANSTSTLPRKETSMNLEKEMKEYDKLLVPRKRPNVISWWNDETENFPLLSGIALDITSTPVTEVSVERLFSHLKIVLSKHRSKLNGSLLEDILFLRLNKLFEGK